MTGPAVDLHESDREYIVEAELPGVKKDNVEVRVGDNGQSITIEGKFDIRSPAEHQQAATTVNETAEAQIVTDTAEPPPQQSSEQAQLSLPRQDASDVGADLRELTSERQFVGSSMFTRTLWLPRRVESTNVTAKMEDGVLTVRVPKLLQSEPDAVKVPIA